MLGDAMLDVLARTDAELVTAGDVPGRVAVRPGGQGATVAVRLARRGVSVRLVTALADDPAGRMLRTTLIDDGVELAAMEVAASGSVVVLVDSAGERTMLSHRAPFAHLVSGELGQLAPLASPGSWVVVSGYLLLEPNAAGLVQLLGTLTTPVAILGCALPDAAQAATWLGRVRDGGAALVIVNAAEAGALLGSGPGTAVDEPSLAVALAADVRAMIIVTGPSGAVAAGPEGSRARVASVSRPGAVIDTTGAGDAFAAGVIASLADGRDLDVALLEGVTLAAAVARVEGAQTRVAGERGGTLSR